MHFQSAETRYNDNATESAEADSAKVEHSSGSYQAEDLQNVPAACSVRQCVLYAVRGEWRCACLTVIVITCFIGATMCETLKYASGSGFVASFTTPSAPVATSTVNTLELLTDASEIQTDNHIHRRNLRTTLAGRLFCQTSYLVISGALLCLFYLVYLIECWNSPVWMRTAYSIDPATAYGLIRFFRNATPFVSWHVSCYHYDKVREIPAKNEDQVDNKSNAGESKVSGTRSLVLVAAQKKDIHCRRIVTASASRKFDCSKLDGVWDVSGTVSRLEDFALVEMNLKTDYIFSDDQSKSEFERQKEKFFQQFEQCDIYMETNQDVQLSTRGPCPSHLVICRSAPQLPIYLRQTTFLLAALLLLSYPLRLLIYYRTARLNYTVRKVFGQKPSSDFTCPTVIYGPSTGHYSQSLSGTILPYDMYDNKQNGRVLSSTKSNNEAVILFNRDVNSTTPAPKRRWEMVKENDEADDEELLSLDIRFDESSRTEPVDSVLQNKYIVEPT